MSLRMAIVKVQDVRRGLMLDENIWRRTVPEAIMVAASQMVPAYVEAYVPRRTGELQDSAQIEVNPTSMRLWFEAPYAEIVDRGALPSLGRFVPMIEKRLIKPSVKNPSIGMHPGFQGRNFFEQIANNLKEDLRGIIEVIIRREWLR